ncbi:hypothetical protein V8C44DRAFT_325833 [Trichoderma aethiopicum]
MKSTTNMHPFYRLFFSKLDPLIMIYSAYRNILTSTSAHSSTSALGLYNLDEDEDFYNISTYLASNNQQQQQTFALVAALATMAALVQHYSDDYNLWRIVQFVLLVWNFSFFNGTTYWWWWRGEGMAVGVEGVYCTEVLTLLILARIAFLVGFGTRGRRVIRNGVLYDGWI